MLIENKKEKKKNKKVENLPSARENFVFKNRLLRQQIFSLLLQNWNEADVLKKRGEISTHIAVNKIKLWER